MRPSTRRLARSSSPEPPVREQWIGATGDLDAALERVAAFQRPEPRNHGGRRECPHCGSRAATIIVRCNGCGAVLTRSHPEPEPDPDQPDPPDQPRAPIRQDAGWEPIEANGGVSAPAGAGDTTSIRQDAGWEIEASPDRLPGFAFDPLPGEAGADPWTGHGWP